MNHRIVAIVLIPITLLIALWLTNYLLNLPDILRNYGLGLVVSIFLLLIIAPKYPLDYKFLVLVCLGYSLGGKGFAYISPFEPFFIGEICFVLCAIGLLVRVLSGEKMLSTGLSYTVLIWIIFIGLRVYFDFQTYGKDAIRDSAMAYYGLFFFSFYVLMRREKLRKSFEKIFPLMLLFGCIGKLTIVTMIAYRWNFSFYLPHADLTNPLVATGAACGIAEGIRRRKPMILLTGLVFLVVLLGGKTAGVLCFVAICGVAVVFAKRIELVAVGIISALVGMLLFSFIQYSDSELVNEYIDENEHFETFSRTLSENVGDDWAESSTDWRIAWWKIIVRDTFNGNWVMGTGLGGDLTTNFVNEILEREVKRKGDARYPHNVIFTVLGRLGVLGLCIFLLMFFPAVNFAFKFCGNYVRHGSNPVAFMVWAFWFAGLVNAVVQSTYEAPYAAIPHWMAFGYVVRYHVDMQQLAIRRKISSTNSQETPDPIVLGAS